MKRLLSIIVLSFAIVSVYAKGFFGDRFFEVKYSVPVGISNNAISISDIFKKELVIDLNQLADKVPSDGLIITTTANPAMAMNLRIAKLFVGVSTGIDYYSRFVISDDLFTLLGKGTEPEQEMEAGFQTSADLFATVNTDLGLTVKGDTFHIQPSLFIPVFSAFGDVGKLTYLNTDKGDVNVKFQTDIGLYSLFDFNDPSKDLNTQIFKRLGFDLGGSYRHPFREKFAFEFVGRVPIIPGNLPYLSKIEYGTQYGMKLLGSLDNEEEEETTTDGTDVTKVKETDEVGVVNTMYTLGGQIFYINRPMKLDFYLEYFPMGSLLTLRGGLGLGVYHPFTSGYELYIDSYFGLLFNLGLVKAGLSTEYTDRIFKHQLSMSVNVRVIQIDAGISLQAASFTKSFAGTGVGAFANVSIGF